MRLLQCLDNSFGLQPAPEGGTQCRKLPGLGCGPGECPDKVSWPWDCCKSLQTWPLDVPALSKQLLGVVLMGKTRRKSIFVFFILKKISRARKRERKNLGFALSLDSHHPPLSFELSLCPLGRRGKYLSSIRVKFHVEFIKQEYKASLLYPRFLPCVFLIPPRALGLMCSSGAAWPWNGSCCWNISVKSFLSPGLSQGLSHPKLFPVCSPSDTSLV